MKKLPLLGGLFYILSITSCKNEVASKGEKTDVFPVTRPVVLDTVYYNEYVADIHSIKRVEVRARVKGFIDRIHVDEGQNVREGQVLFTISSQEYREDLLKARAILKSAIAEAKAAELDLHNTRLLVEKNVISKTELDIASAKLDALNARIEEARSHEASASLRLSFTSVKAPFSGIIDRIPNKAGSLINEGDLLTTLSDNSEVYAYFNVSEKEYLDYSESIRHRPANTGVSLILANNTEHAARGIIETIEGEFNQNTGSIAFRARFTNPGFTLKNGSSGKVRLKREVEDALVIPQKSAFEIQDKIYVYIVDANDTVRMKSFTAGLRIPHLYVVGAGLSTRDRILYEGIQDVKEGMKIKTRDVHQNTIIRQLSQR